VEILEREHQWASRGDALDHGDDGGEGRLLEVPATWRIWRGQCLARFGYGEDAGDRRGHDRGIGHAQVAQARPQG